MEPLPKKISDDDPDNDSVPAAKLKRAKPGDAAPLPSNLAGRDNDGGTRGMMLAGSHPAAVVLNGMATIEQQIKAMSKFVPGLTAVAAPFLDEMKAASAAGLADLVSGGLGNVNSAPPPPAGAGMPAMAPPAGPGMGMPMPPPPPMM